MAGHRIDMLDIQRIIQLKARGGSEMYVGAMRNYWNSYHTMRRLTLYDFESDSKIVVELQEFD